MLIEHEALETRQKLSQLNAQFAAVDFKFYYVKVSNTFYIVQHESQPTNLQELRGDMTGRDLVYASKDSVSIETLRAGTLGLPSVAGPVYEYKHESGFGALALLLFIPLLKSQSPNIADVRLLHPGVLILTKMKRWLTTCESTRPKTLAKNRSDARDLRWLVDWLVGNEMTIDFDNYEGKSKGELMGYVRIYREKFREDEDFMVLLKKAIKPEDWNLL